MGVLFIPCQRQREREGEGEGEREREREYGFHALLIRLETFIRRAHVSLLLERFFKIPSVDN